MSNKLNNYTIVELIKDSSFFGRTDLKFDNGWFSDIDLEYDRYEDNFYVEEYHDELTEQYENGETRIIIKKWTYNHDLTKDDYEKFFNKPISEFTQADADRIDNENDDEFYNEFCKFLKDKYIDEAMADAAKNYYKHSDLYYEEYHEYAPDYEEI